MSEVLPLGRAGVVRIVALAAFAALSLTSAVILDWVLSGWLAQASEYFETSNGSYNPNDPAADTAQRLSELGYQTSNLVPPLVIAGLVAVFVILGVLALRWARQHPLRP